MMGRKTRTKKYVRSMMMAIELAKGSSTKANGLRAIRKFEEVNNIEFDPSNRSHQLVVCGRGDTMEFFRSVKIKRSKGVLWET